jgi:vacuolar ATPase assembly integral membrane protein VMA21
MATRRIVAQEKSILEKDDKIGNNPAASEKASIAPAVST